MKILLICAGWLVWGSLLVWLGVAHHYLIAIPFEVLLVPVMYSLTTRAVLGTWPPWGKVFHLFIKGVPPDEK